MKKIDAGRLAELGGVVAAIGPEPMQSWCCTYSGETAAIWADVPWDGERKIKKAPDLVGHDVFELEPGDSHKPKSGVVFTVFEKAPEPFKRSRIVVAEGRCQNGHKLEARVRQPYTRVENDPRLGTYERSSDLVMFVGPTPSCQQCGALFDFRARVNGDAPIVITKEAIAAAEEIDPPTADLPEAAVEDVVDVDENLIEYEPHPRHGRRDYEISCSVLNTIAAGGKVLLVDKDGNQVELAVEHLVGTNKIYEYVDSGVVQEDWQFDWGDEWPGGWKPVPARWVSFDISVALIEVEKRPTGVPKRFRRLVRREPAER